MAYHVALEGVSGWSLTQAVVDILRGSLPHGFFPSPPEFRRACQDAMRPIYQDLQRKEADRIRREQEAEFSAVQPKTEAQKQVVTRAYRSFCDAHRAVTDQVDPDEELAEIRSKYDPADLARIPDREV